MVLLPLLTLNPHAEALNQSTLMAQHFNFCWVALTSTIVIVMAVFPFHKLARTLRANKMQCELESANDEKTCLSHQFGPLMKITAHGLRYPFEKDI